MCLIVDANLCHLVFKNSSDVSYKKLRDSIFSNRVTVLFGGPLVEEYKKANVIPVLALLSQSGRAFRVENSRIESEILKIKGKCESNDLHVIALARADRVRGRVLCTDDKALQRDFKNKTLIDNPRGTIYSPKNHRQCLAKC